MEIKVLVNNTDEATSFSSDIEVCQANNAPLVNPQYLVRIRNGRIWAFVPENSPSVKEQVDQDKTNRLVDCYKECIMAAAAQGANSVIIPELGGNLYWRPLQTGMAARRAIEEVASSVVDDFVVVFVVPEESHEGWDDAMRF